MPDLLLELFSEEIPARMQRRAAEDLRKLVTDALVEAGLVYEGAKAFVTPRRLALTVHGFPWPKSMRWGAASAKPGSLSWVRPLHSIVCTFGPETEDPQVVDFEVGGIRAGNVTYGHRFLAPGPITVRRFADYADKLEKAKVVLDTDRRRDTILHGARDQALALGLE